MEDFISRFALYVPGFLMAIVFHEAAHAYVALKFGDDTAKLEGRLSLNPIVHMDIIGTVIFPLFLIMMPGGMMFGWAKPVPINSSRFKNFRKGIFWVSAAGPLSNLLLGTVSAFLCALASAFFDLGAGNPMEMTLGASLFNILYYSVIINFVLAGFNLIPLPPLDGSRMLASFLSYNAARKYEEFGKYSIIIFLVAMYTHAFSYVLMPFLATGKLLVALFVNLMG
jgi:Zn-dependent protease